MKLSTGMRRSMKKSDFAVPEKAPGPCSLPVPDCGHCKAARGLCGKCPEDACNRVETKCKEMGC